MQSNGPQGARHSFQSEDTMPLYLICVIGYPWTHGPLALRGAVYAISISRCGTRGAAPFYTRWARLPRKPAELQNRCQTPAGY
jgi:hypothetical protein